MLESVIIQRAPRIRHRRIVVHELTEMARPHARVHHDLKPRLARLAMEIDILAQEQPVQKSD
jgi:hypothetical protein